MSPSQTQLGTQSLQKQYTQLILEVSDLSMELFAAQAAASVNGAAEEGLQSSREQLISLRDYLKQQVGKSASACTATANSVAGDRSLRDQRARFAASLGSKPPSPAACTSTGKENMLHLY